VVGETIAKRYELQELAGHGGMSSVYRAYDALLERNVALKILHEHFSEDEEFVERFKREARSVAQLQHPNIVTVIDRGEENGRQYIVFEYVDGENLKELVVRKGRLDMREALEIAIKIARGLAFAHDHGLVHRDVKPQNVLLNGDDHAKVTDFGIARSIDVEHGVTQTGTVLGSSNYIAPEQASGQPVSAQTDVYSLGVVLYELLTGDVPFPGESFVAVALKHIHEQPPNVLHVRRDVPLRVAAAIDRALAKDPGRRYPTMDDFAAELEACLAELDHGPEDDEATMVVPPQGVARRRRRRSRWPVGIAALALLAGAVAVGVLTLGGGSGKTSAGRGTPIAFSGLTSYDPYSADMTEHAKEAPMATDHNRSTYWTTEQYTSFTKPGVGVVLDAHRLVQLKSVTVVTDTLGFTAEIQATNVVGGTPQTVSAARVVNGTTNFPIRSGAPFRYYVVWVTKLPPTSDVVHVNEVRAFASS
jgi:serine/threonine-protein kinase